MARHLAFPFLAAVLNRGKSVAQLLSYRADGGRRVIRWVELRQRTTVVDATLHEVLDAASEGLLDVAEFPALDEAEPHGEGKTRSFESLVAALDWVERELGGSRERFVNSGVIHDEVDDARSASSLRPRV